MSNFGSDYAAAYDSMYQDKDYSGECDQLEWAFKEFATAQPNSILDIGCGTGKHSWELANRGYQVTGMDRSIEMLNLAKMKHFDEQAENKPIFKQGDATDFDLMEKFDAVIMMFAVVSYLSSNPSLISGLENVARHLKPGGLFLADFWYGPGVLKDNPTQRSHTRKIGDVSVERRVTPHLNLPENTCQLTYEVITTGANNVSHSTTEEHVMRYFFGPELELALSSVGLELLHLGNCPDWNKKLEEAAWTGSLVARRS